MGENDHASFIVDEQDGVGERLDVWLSEKLALSRSQTKGYIDQGFIVVNNQHVKAGFKLRPNDTCQVSIPAPKPLGILAESIPLNIVYEDEDLIVINKQKGLVVHPAAGNWNGTLVNALLEHCNDLSGIGGKLRPGIVHRLDKDTSGLMVVAKNDRAHRHLAEQIKMRAVKRHYLALVYGNPPEEKGTIEAPLGRHPVHRKKMGIVDDGRYAVTHFSVKERMARFSLLECRLETGRTHQIRVHLAAIKHPIVGDSLYGRKKDELGAHSQALHAYYLAFDHPSQGFMEFEGLAPEEFLTLVARAREKD